MNTRTKKKLWYKIWDGVTETVWEYAYGGGITIECVFDPFLQLWLVYGAQDGKRLAENPMEARTKKEAISFIAQLKKKFKKDGIRALR